MADRRDCGIHKFEVDMKKSLFNMRGSNILLAIGCLLLAIVFWFVVEYTKTDSLPIFTFDFS